MSDPPKWLPSPSVLYYYMDNCQESRNKWLKEEESLRTLLHSKTGDPVILPFLFLKDITQNFSYEQRIGCGGFGEVYKGQLQNGMVIAVKKLLRPNEIPEKNFLCEVDCLTQANKHNNINIVRLLGYCYETLHLAVRHEGKHLWVDNNQMLFCFEYLSEGNLKKHRTEPSTGLQWKARYQIIKGICEGVCYLHQQRIIHMDLKPENILLDGNMVPKIVDFGLSRRLSESQSRIITENIFGTLGYVAPELYRSPTNRSPTITFKADIYSLGVIIIEILTGSKEKPNVDKVLQSWMDSTFVKSECHPRLLEQVKVCADIGINCMDDSPGNRPAIEDIIGILGETDLSISSSDSSGFVPEVEPENRSLLRRFQGKLLENVNASSLMNRFASLYSSARGVASISSAGELVDEPESRTGFYALSQLEQSAFYWFYNHYGLGKQACKPIRISKYTAAKPTGRLSDTEQLDVHPLKLRFSLEARKPIKCSLSLVNRTDRDVICLIIPQFSDMYAYKDELAYYRMHLDPMSTGILNVTMVEQGQLPLDTGMFLVLMFVTGRTNTDGLEDLISSVDYGFPPKIDDELLKRMEELGGEMHAATVLTVIARPPRDASNPNIVWSVNLKDIVVKAIDVHPEWPWILGSDDRNVFIWNYENQAIRFAPGVHEGATSVVFIRKQWFAAGDHCGDIHVYNIITMTKIKFKAFDGSPVLSLAIHPTCPYLLSACYSGVVKLCNWELGFQFFGSFQLNSFFVNPFQPNSTAGGRVLAKFNPNLKDTHTFISGEEHGTLKVWSYYHHSPHRPITTIAQNSTDLFDYVFTETGRSLVVIVCNNGLDIWDLQTRARVHTLRGTGGFIGALSCHPTLPLIVAGIKRDDFQTPIVHFWNSTNYRLEKTIGCTYGSRIINLGFVGSKRLVIGTDKGIEVMEIDMANLTGGFTLLFRPKLSYDQISRAMFYPRDQWWFHKVSWSLNTLT